MNENLRSELEMEYERLRETNEREEARRLAEAGTRDPQIPALLARRRDLFLEQARQAFAAPSRAMDISARLRAELESIAGQLEARLLSMGLPKDYLQPVYHCALCRDTGFVGELLHERCNCWKARMHARVCQDGALGVRGEETFERWEDAIFPEAPTADVPQGQRAYMRRVRTLCEEYANAFPDNPKRTLLFTGGSGLGKTFLMNCIAERVLARGHTAWRLTAHQMMSLLRDSAFGKGDSRRQRMLYEVPLLLIDDLGTEAMLENVTIPQLFHLFNERGNSRLGLVVSSNLTSLELKERYTERVCSRLFDRRNTVFVRFLGRDLRLLNEG